MSLDAQPGPPGDLDVLDFDGEPFDPLAWTATGPTADPGAPATRPQPPSRPEGATPDIAARDLATRDLTDQSPATRGLATGGLATGDLAPRAGREPHAADHRTDGAPGRGPQGRHAQVLLGQIRAGVVAAHGSALVAANRLQAAAVADLVTGPPPTDPEPNQPALWVVPTRSPGQPSDSTRAGRPLAPSTGAHLLHLTLGPEGTLAVVLSPLPAGRPVIPPGRPEPADSVTEFKPLAATGVHRLDAAALERLRDGAVAEVFGAAYAQPAHSPTVRLAPGPLRLVHAIDRRGGEHHRGRLAAVCAPATGDRLTAEDLVAAAWQAAQVLALQIGLHLPMPVAHFELDDALGGPEIGRPATPTGPHDPPAPPPATPVLELLDDPHGTLELELQVVDSGLVPRPRLRFDVEFRRAATLVARVSDLALRVREDAPIALLEGGVAPAFLGRYAATGQEALLGEFQMAHSARGDLGIALGPEFAAYAGRRATRIPSNGLQMCDRVIAVHGTRGDLVGGATIETEYDSPADLWYYREGGPAMPNVMLMETSLQSALVLGYFLGSTLTSPQEDYSLRNLDGTATVLREVDLRGRTIRQRSTLLSTTVLQGAVLQNLSYELLVDDEPFYRGTSLFGFFNARALANQTGLDNGEFVPTWLDGPDGLGGQDGPGGGVEVRRVDVRERPAVPGPPPATGHLALLDVLEIVDGGGRFGQGYLRSVQRVDPDAWFFQRHFWLDPVMPGSLGVEAIVQALREWLVDTGLTADLRDPQFVLPVDVALQWRYRGQILPDDGHQTIEIHVKQVRRGPGRVRVVADASVWKPGLRIYELIDVAAEAREEGAQPWS